MDSNQPQSATSGTGSEAYYSGVDDRIEHINESVTQHKSTIGVLSELDKTVSEIDCDHGGANIELSGPMVKVTTSTHGMPEVLQNLVSDYTWPVTEEINYDEETRCIQWVLESDIKRLTDDYVQANPEQAGEEQVGEVHNIMLLLRGLVGIVVKPNETVEEAVLREVNTEMTEERLFSFRDDATIEFEDRGATSGSPGVEA